MPDKGLQFIQVVLRQPLDGRASMQMLAICPFQAQMSIQDSTIDVEQVRTPTT